MDIKILMRIKAINQWKERRHKDTTTLQGVIQLASLSSNSQLLNTDKVNGPYLDPQYPLHSLSTMIPQARTEKLFGFSLALLYTTFWLQTTWPRINEQTSSSSTIEEELEEFQQDTDIRTVLDRTTKINLRKQAAAKEEEFCVSWEVNTDDFWTHNPEWEISRENDTNYCFRRLPNKKAKFFRSLYETQFQRNCSSSLTKKMWNSGWGADLSNVVDGLKFAHESNKPFEIHTNTFGWHYAAKKDGSMPVCSQKNLQCYFLNTTSCDTHSRPINSRQSFLAGPWQGFHRDIDYLDYLVRPQTWLRKQVYDFLKPYRLEAPCTVLHVRRGDVVLLDPTPRRYHAIDEYMDESHNVTQNLLLLTDDHNAISEALHNYPQHNWVYVNKTRYKGAEGGWEEHIPSDSPQQEVVALLSAIRLAKTCNKLVHSKSNLADYIYAQMKSSHSMVKKINLDQGQKRVHHADNVKSVSLSKAYS